VSNFRGWRITEMVHIAARLGVPPPVVCQPYYNLLNRMPEVEILPACHHHGIGVASYSPIARGVLTGKYAPGAAPDPTTRAGRADKRMVETEFRQESLVIAQTLGAHAQSRGVTLAQFATAWVLANGMLSSVSPGHARWRNGRTISLPSISGSTPATRRWSTRWCRKATRPRPDSPTRPIR
jgi:aryl-alcohol dehydrogenase-like predicted oxidoreductase